jgi:hypothetical protein
VARPEITGRKARATARGTTAPPPIRGPPIPPAAYTIEQFCEAHQMSVSMYFKMRARGEGPDEMSYGRRRAISLEAAARWRAQKEAETAAATVAAE